MKCRDGSRVVEWAEACRVSSFCGRGEVDQVYFRYGYGSER